MPALQRIDIKPAVLQWALDSAEDSRRRVTEQRTQVQSWIAETKKPTFNQLVALAKDLAVPFGYLLLDEPPVRDFTQAYFRKGVRADSSALSANAKALVLDTDQKSDWAESYLLDAGHDPLTFVGSVSLADDPQEVAKAMRSVIAYSSSWTASTSSWSQARLEFIKAIEEAGIFVVASGGVGNNTHRTIDPEELNGFAIVRPRAPFVFVNSADFVARQIFTLAHELVHVWLGDTVIDAVSFESLSASDETEEFCNEVASYFLAPPEEIEQRFKLGTSLAEIAEIFKVSAFAVNRALLGRGLIDDATYFGNLRDLRDAISPKTKGVGGGDYYATAAVRSSKRFVGLLRNAYDAKGVDLRGASRLLNVKGRALVKLLQA